MRNIESIKTEKIRGIINKITDKYFLSVVLKLDELYGKNTEDGNILFLDTLIGLEPILKIEIQKGNISEREMDCFIGFYGSVNHENI